MSVRPRRPKGPPLNALRAFEVAARLESFVDAAEELGVTPGAVSQHVKALEAWAGVMLFDRSRTGVALSPAGRELCDAFTDAFDHLADATKALRNLAENPEIHIAAMPSVAQLWLPSRLEKIRASHPHLNISVTALEAPPRLSRDLYDMGVFLGAPDGSDAQVVLSEDKIFPVASQDWNDTADLSQATLLHDLTWAKDWAMWFGQNRTPEATQPKAPNIRFMPWRLQRPRQVRGF